MDARDRELGMDRQITRRDFLNGVAVGISGSLVAPALSEASRAAPVQPAAPAAGYYPPALTGMRGSHVGSFEVAHALREGARFDNAPDNGERYDLVVVGAGISGLAAAYFFMADTGSKTRVLLLDNHDDFGGHAKRNEFTYNGRTLLLNGGTSNLEVTGQYSAVARTLLAAIGVDFERLAKASSSTNEFYASMKLGPATFFCREIFGEDRLVLGSPGRGRGAPGSPGGSRAALWAEWLAKTPLSPAAQKDIARLYDDNQPDYLAGLSDSDKKERLARMSYKDFVLNLANVTPEAVPFLAQFGADRHSIDAEPALYAWNAGNPGFQGLRLEPSPKVGPVTHLGGTQHGAETVFGGGPTLEFPDGNATIARLLVRQLVPDAVPGNTMEDVVTSRVDYARLDRPGNSTRVRLNSTVVRVKHLGDPERSSGVDVSYVRGGNAETVRAQHVIMACWNMIIPYLAPELPEKQKEALHLSVKKPMVYTSVCLKKWQAFAKLGVRRVDCPGMFNDEFSLGRSPMFGAYRGARSPGEPTVLNLTKTWIGPGKTERDQFRAGRGELFSTTFDTFERRIRDQIARGLSGTDFDPAADIVAITVNRWPHGSTYLYNSLFDPLEWSLLEAEDKPNIVGRRRFGRISVANADAAGTSHTDAAIDEGYRAVGEQLVVRSRTRPRPTHPRAD